MRVIIKNLLNKLIIIVFVLAPFGAIAQSSYQWKSVPIKGGGLVSGLIYSKAQADLLYARTDVGGAYRWNPSLRTWTSLTDGMTSGDDWGIWSVAPDPGDADKVYIATGLYTADWGKNGSIYMSSDKGDTWTLISALPFKLGGNDPGRGSGERLQVDPNKPSVLYLGSAENGLYKSTDSGNSWTKVNSFTSSYITFVELDPASGKTGTETPTIYVGVADAIYGSGNAGVFRSQDGGNTWNKLPNHPAALVPKTFAPGNNALLTVPSKMTIASNGVIYFTFNNSITPNGNYKLSAPHNSISNGALYKYIPLNNTWFDITPSGSNGHQGGFSSVAVHPSDPDKIVLSTIERWWPADELYFSSDGGTNWASTFNSYSYASSWGNSLNKGSYSTVKAPYAASLTAHWTTTVTINPLSPNQVMIGTGFGVFVCNDVSGLFTNANSSNAVSTTWIFENDGLEETVPLEIVSPPTGPSLISAIGDFDGFVHSDLTVSPVNGRFVTSGNKMGTTSSLAFAEALPTKLVKTHSNDSYVKGSYSTDGGTSWTLFPSQPASVSTNTTGGQITLSANGAVIVWAPDKGVLSFSNDNGATWKVCGGNIPNSLKPIADRVNSNKFYVYDSQNQRFYYSTNGGISFDNTAVPGSAIASFNTWQTSIAAVFGKEGHVWVASREGGLFRTTNSGSTFTKVSSVTEAYKVTFGKAATISDYPAVFLWGKINDVSGLFRSDDEGMNWIQITDQSHEYGRNFNTISGDQRVYGRIYAGTGGRGIVYGDISNSTVTGYNESSLSNGDVRSFYPNPFTSELKINVYGNFTYSFHSLTGVELESGHGTNFISAGKNLPIGIYYLKILNDKGSKLVKVIKR